MTRGRDISNQRMVREVGVCDQLPLRGWPLRVPLLWVEPLDLEEGEEAVGVVRGSGCERVDTIVVGRVLLVNGGRAQSWWIDGAV